MRVVFFVLLTLWIVSPLVGADQKSHRYARGEKVELKIGADIYPAEVVAVFPNRFLAVTYTDNVGFDRRITVPPNFVRPLPKTRKTAKSGRTPAESVAKSNPMRTWSDKLGKFSIKARFLEIKEGNARLEQDDGKTISIPLDKLSEADRKVAEQSPAATGGTPLSLEEAAQPAAELRGTPELPKGDWLHARPVSGMVPPTGPWKLTADPGAGTAKPLKARAIGLRKSSKTATRDLTWEVEAFVPIRDRNEAMMFTTGAVDTAFNPQPTLLVHRIDLVKGKAAEPLPLKCAGFVLDVDRAGRRVAVTSHPMRFNGKPFDQLQVWDLGKSKPTLVKAWNAVNPDDKSFMHGIASPFARFIDAGHLLTVDRNSALVIWEIANQRALYQMSLTPGHEAVALSPGGKYLAVGVPDGVAILDSLSGQTLGLLRSTPSFTPILAFEPNGRHLAEVTFDHVTVWDFEKGETYRDFGIPKSMVGETLDWVADGYLLAGDSVLIDIERRVVLWQYRVDSMNNRARTSGEQGGVYWFAAHTALQNGIVGAELPHAAARRAAASLKPDELLLLKPGVHVNLSVHIRGSEAEQQQAKDSLTAKLQKLGLVIDDSSSLILSATTQTGKSVQQQYQSSGMSRNTGKVETATVTKQIARVQLKEGNKVLWEAASLKGAPIFVHHGKNESLQSAINKEEQKQDVGFFSQVQLPQYLARGGEYGVYGASKLTVDGIEDVPIASLYNGPTPVGAPGASHGAGPGMPGRSGRAGSSGL